MTYALRVIMITMILGFGLLGFGTFAVAEEGEIQAMAPWTGEGHAFPIGNDRVYMVAVYRIGATSELNIRKPECVDQWVCGGVAFGGGCCWHHH